MKTPDKPQTATKLRLPDGSVIDAEVLDQEDREAYIEFAIHLAAPKLAKLLAGELSSVKQQDKTVPSQKYDDLYFNLPVTLTVKEAAEFLRCSTYKIYEMCRIYQGRSFPHVRLGSQVVIPRAGFIQFTLKKNIPQGREGWELTTCQECGSECWLLPQAKDMLKEDSDYYNALCTVCALRKA